MDVCRHSKAEMLHNLPLDPCFLLCMVSKILITVGGFVPGFYPFKSVCSTGSMSVKVLNNKSLCIFVNMCCLS